MYLLICIYPITETSTINKNNFKKLSLELFLKLSLHMLFHIYLEQIYFTIKINCIMAPTSIGMPFIAASDCVTDEATTYLLNSSSNFDF